MQYSVDSNSLNSYEIKQGLLGVADELDRRVKVWKYPPAEEEIRSETDPDVLANREHIVFGRSLRETFQRHDLERILVWLEYRHPTVAIQLQAITDALNEKIPAAKHASQSDLDDLVVDFGQAAYKIRHFADQIPGSESQVVGTSSKQIPDALAGKSRKEIYEHLLCEFRREHASPRKGSILLQLVSEKMFQLQKELLPKEILFCEAKVLEHKLAPIGEPCNLYCDGFRVVCVPYTSEVLQNSERSQFDRDALTAWEKFSDLATHAGAQLGKTFREVMPGSGEKPLTNWLQLMFCTLREQIDLESAYGDCCNFSHIPFSDAADVIEQCRLNTDDPILPPVLQTRKERIDAIPEAPVKTKGEPTIEVLDHLTPTLDKDSLDWIQASDPRMKKEASVRSLRAMRNDGSARKNSEGTFGVDKSRRRWRKDSKEAKSVYYLRDTLKSDLATKVDDR